MNILAVGDVIGTLGIEKLKQELEILRKTETIDFVIVNGENSSDGMGITEKEFNEFLKLNVDIVTMGNHTWAKRDVFKFINHDKIVRPANYNKNIPGNRYKICNCNGKKIAVINLIGRVEMGVLSENPFLVMDAIVEKIRKDVDIIIVDFHAEATAEKLAMAYYLDGKVNVLFGTHTHVQTADEKIFKNGMAYITDIGMTGPKESVIGMDIEASLKRFVTSLPERYKIAKGDAMFNACIFKINDKDCKIEEIIRINR